MSKGIRKLKYYNPFNVKKNDNVVFCYSDNQEKIGKILDIDYPLVLINVNYNIFVIYIGQIKRKIVGFNHKIVI